jgi:hypothetical protein
MTFTDDELRMLGLCAPVILRMFKAREDRIISRMYGEFRNGKVDHLTAIAELACVRDQIHEIQSALARNEKGKEA